jgi:hypothetical protein
MFKFEYNGVIYQAKSIEKLQQVLQKAGLKIDMETLLLNEQQEILNEVLNEQSEIANEQSEIANDELQDIINEEYAEQLADKKVNNKLN